METEETGGDKTFQLQPIPWVRAQEGEKKARQRGEEFSSGGPALFAKSEITVRDNHNQRPVHGKEATKR